VSFLRPVILGWLQDFWKVCALLHYAVTARSSTAHPPDGKQPHCQLREKICCVFRRCNRAVSDYEKHGLQMKSTQTLVNSFDRSFNHLFIHSFIRLTNFVMAIHGLAVKQEDQFPTFATQPELQTVAANDALSFGKYQGL
jgi:hypothetical protein